MAKKQSSASSATRKKHAAKQAKRRGGGDDTDDDGGDHSGPVRPLQRGQNKSKKDRKQDKKLRVKQYIPPPPPPKGLPDPVDLYLVQAGKQPDAELVVVLRRLHKKDEATISRGVDGLEGWVRETLRMDADGDGEDWQREIRQEGVVDCMAVWAHHFPRLALHPSRRLRLQVHSLHSLLVANPASLARRHAVPPLLVSTRFALLTPLRLESRDYVGAWCTAAWDNDRTIRREARGSWDAVLLPLSTEAESAAEKEGINLVEQADSIASFCFSVILGGATQPVPSSGTDTPTSASDLTEDPAFLRTSAILALSYLVSTLPSPFALSEDTLSTLTGEQMWELVVRNEPSSGTREQPQMVRRAMYELLGAIVGTKADELLAEAEKTVEAEGENAEDEDEEEDAREARLTGIAVRVLANCWAEEDGWPGILAFLRRYPQAWSLADATLAESAEYDDQDDTAAANFSPSPTLSLFFQHLSSGCSSHPTSLYPTILLLLSTIPSSLLPATRAALPALFTSFWSAHSSRALAINGRFAIDAWISAFLECLLYSLSKVEDSATVVELAKEWVGGKVWRAYLGRLEEGEGRPIASKKIASEIQVALSRLAAKDDKGAFEAVWKVVVKGAMDVLAGEADGWAISLPSVAMALQTFGESKSEVVREKGNALAKDCLEAAVRRVPQEEKLEAKEELLRFVLDTKELLKNDEQTMQSLDELARSHLPPLFPTSPLALSVFASHLASSSTSSRAETWTSLFPTPPSTGTLLRLVDAVTDTGLAGDLPSAGLDEHVKEIAGRVLAPDARYDGDDLELVRRVMLQPQPLVNPELPSSLLRLAVDALRGPTTAALTASSTVPRNLDSIIAPTALIAHYVQLADNSRAVALLDGAAGLLANVAYLVPNCRLEREGLYVPGEAVAAAQQAWSSVVQVVGDEVVAQVVAQLQGRIDSVHSRPSAVEVVSAAADVLDTSPSTATALSDVLPSKEAIEQLFSNLSLSRPSPSLAIIDALVPPVDASAPSIIDAFDSSSLSAYSRALVAFLEVSARDHTILRRFSWILPHLLLVADVARDELAKPSRSSGLFGSDVPEEILERVLAASEGASSYLLSSAANRLSSGWHASAVGHLRVKERPAVPDGDDLLATLDQLWTRAKTNVDEANACYAQRAVRTVLEACLRYSEDGGPQDAERWLAMAQNLTSAPDLACAILLAIKPVLLDTPRFDRYQNELAANLAGVQPSAIDVKASPALRQLLAAAPPLDAPVIFLPQQRSMFLIQAISRWISSDEPIPEEVHAGIAELFCHLAPIVQDLSGGHWDLMFDLIETSLDAADWDEPITLLPAYHSCRLLSQIKDLAAANADLRDTAKARLTPSLEMVLRLFVNRSPARTRDEPRAALVDTMARLVKDLPPKLLSMDKSFEQLLRLLQDPAWAVQLPSYDLLRRVVKGYVEDLVVEAELDTEEKIEIRLPESLVALLRTPVIDDSMSATTTYLLGWMTAFSFFGSASPRLRTAYIEQMRDEGIVEQSLLPSLFTLLSISDRTRPFDLAPWSIDDFHLDLFDATSASSLPVLAAHVYYRALQAVPSVIRSYWSSLQNLQLSRTIQSFTSRHFSPLLISDELLALSDPSSPVGQQLRDNDDFCVKVAANASEVKVVFVVDEESMEVAVKVPSEFPLAGVEIKDVRKVGVTEKQWRAWLLAMQQVITSQSAAIADAILLFKRNVQLHFEGVESCAICYSTVSTIDRTLPSKKCKTCGQVFHAGCLHRWFVTSSGATCPLCRGLW
ncbi:ubiquitin-protein ligase E3 [Rhodotorula toruloides]|uniref:E3 ubiquitin-protein ligase listerin n=1 Tax=Rhodotorula toruloides TaxID=5286 RepID=A0A511KQG2_RHOTO|nr:ubiquitin-protein ligase E3 [Rhodotorula toruloides]